MNEELISIIIPTYGRSEYLVRALNSVRSQTYKNLDIIVVDDNGKNSKQQIEVSERIKLLSDSRVRYLVHESNMNGSAARNTGIENAKGEYICFLDDDDEFAIDKIEKQHDILKNLDSDWVACYTGHNKYFNQSNKKEYIPVLSGDIFFELLTFSVDVCSGSTLMLRKEAIQKVKGFDVSLKRHQDYDFIDRLAYFGKIAVIPEPLVNIYIHSGSNKQRRYSDIVNTRFQYIEGITPFMDKLNAKQKRIVKYINYYELIKVSIKYRKIPDAINFYFKCGKIIKPIKDLFKDGRAYLGNR